MPSFPALAPFGLPDLLDIAATAVLIYYFLLLIRGTRAVQIGMGLGVLLVLWQCAAWLHLVVLTALLRFILLGTAVTLPIVFQPELRRALEQLGRGGIFARSQAGEQESLDVAMSMIAKAAIMLSRQRVGALVAIERTSGLRDFVESGTLLDARLSIELLLTIFTPDSALHDGAVILKQSCIEAAGCFLPLSENVPAETHRGTRHRAALGLSEQTDAVVVVVSEQSGGISVARNGRLSREIDDEERLRRVLLACCRVPKKKRSRLARRFRSAKGTQSVSGEASGASV